MKTKTIQEENMMECTNVEVDIQEVIMLNMEIMVDFVKEDLQ